MKEHSIACMAMHGIEWNQKKAMLGKSYTEGQGWVVMAGIECN